MLVTLLIFIVVLAILVLAHEWGHFIAARKNGIKVEEFGFGFPPRIFGIQIFTGQTLKKVGETETVETDIETYSLPDGQAVIEEKVIDKIKEVDVVVPVKRWQFVWGNKDIQSSSDFKGGTIYSLNWIPLGGFVKIKGETGEFADEPDSFVFQRVWRRAIVLAAGVTMNFVLAVVFLAIGFMIGLPQSLDSVSSHARITDAKIEVQGVLPGSPAAQAGVVVGDRIMRADNLTNLRVGDLQNYMNLKNGQTVGFAFTRGSDLIETDITPATLSQTGRGGIGVSLLESGIVSYPWYWALYEGLRSAVLFSWEILKAFWFLIAGIFRGAPVAENLSGPVGIAVLTGRVARLGFVYLLQFTAMLSLNLAILNFLPLPALDGGRILFLIIEKIIGRPVKRVVENLIHTVGFALLMLLVVFITYKDVMRFSGNFVRLGKKIIGI